MTRPRRPARVVITHANRPSVERLADGMAVLLGIAQGKVVRKAKRQETRKSA